MHLVVRMDSVSIPFRLVGKLEQLTFLGTPPIQVLWYLLQVYTVHLDLSKIRLYYPKQDLTRDHILSKLQLPLDHQRI